MNDIDIEADSIAVKDAARIETETVSQDKLITADAQCLPLKCVSVPKLA